MLSDQNCIIHAIVILAISKYTWLVRPENWKEYELLLLSWGKLELLWYRATDSLPQDDHRVGHQGLWAKTNGGSGSHDFNITLVLIFSNFFSSRKMKLIWSILSKKILGISKHRNLPFPHTFCFKIKKRKFSSHRKLKKPKKQTNQNRIRYVFDKIDSRDF